MNWIIWDTYAKRTVESGHPSADAAYAAIESRHSHERGLQVRGIPVDQDEKPTGWAEALDFGDPLQKRK